MEANEGSEYSESAEIPNDAINEYNLCPLLVSIRTNVLYMSLNLCVALGGTLMDARPSVCGLLMDAHP